MVVGSLELIRMFIHSTAGEGAAGEGAAEDMPPLEGEDGDDASKMEEVD